MNPKIVCCVGGHSWVYSSVSNRREEPSRQGVTNASTSSDTPNVVSSPPYPSVTPCTVPLGGLSLLGPKLVIDYFANDFLFKGVTKQPSASGKVTGPKLTLSLAVGRLCTLDIGGYKELPETHRQIRTRLYPIAHLRRCFSYFLKL